MQRRTIQLEVNQQINYAETSHQEEWQLQTTGELVELSSYTKISYQDKKEARIELKWKNSFLEGQPLLEIRQPQYSLFFNPEQTTMTHYQTPQGQWELEVETEHLSWTEVDGKQAVTVFYSIKINQESLGKYEFRLIYS